MTEPRCYAAPDGERHRLTVAPALASWDRSGTRSQARSAAFVDDVHRLIAGDLASIDGPLALALDVGLASTVPLFALSDLDNYLFPLVPELSRRTGREFVSVRATKDHLPASFVRIAPARAAPAAPASYVTSLVTTASASTTVYKEQIRDQLVDAIALPGDGVRLELAFVVGPRRVWPNLWKATIDSLGRLVGWDAGAGEWNARDGRITDLRMHCVTDPAIGNSVRIVLGASPV